MVLREARDRVAPVAFANVRSAPGDVQAAPRRVRDDLVRIDRARVARVQMVDAPTFLAVLERVLLKPPTAHHLDEALGRQRRAREQVDLTPLRIAHADASHPSAPLAEVGLRLYPPHGLVFEHELLG